MAETIPVAVPRKGRPLESVLDRIADRLNVTGVADDISSTLRHEKAITKGAIDSSEGDVYDRLATYSDVDEPSQPEFTLLRDDRAGKPRRIVFDSVTIPLEGIDDIPAETAIRLIGRDEPFRALRTHEFGLGFDSADLVLEEVVQLRPGPLEAIADVNARIDPADTDVRVVAGLGDTVYHTLMATPAVAPAGDALDRSFVADYAGPLCITPRYERLVQAVLGTDALDGIEFRYPDADVEEEASVAETGLGVYLTVTGSTARGHGLVLGDRLFPSETVLLENEAEVDPTLEAVRTLLTDAPADTALGV